MQMVRNIEKEYLMLRIMTFFRYFGDCLFYGYFYLFLESRSLSESTIGVITALTPIIALITNPLWSHLSKNANENRKLMIVITVLEGIAILLFTQVSVLELIALLTILVSFVGSPFYSLHDGFIGTFAQTYKKDYTKIRFLGTFAYFFGTIFAAIMLHLTSNNYDLLLLISGIIFVSISLFFISVKPIDLSLTKGGAEVKRNYKSILKNKTFIIYMIVYFLVNTVAFASDNFAGMFFTNYYHLESSVWSLVFGAILLCEFFTMFILSKKTEKLNYNIIWVIISILYPLRSIMFALGLPLPIAICFSLLRGISYGLILVVNIRCIEKICGIENVTSALFVMAIFTAIVQALCNYVFGTVIEEIGYQPFFLIVGIAGFIGMVINLIYQIKNKFTYVVHENLDSYKSN